MTNTLLGTTLLAVPVTALYGALNAFLTVGLSINVSRVRGKHNVFRGDGGHADLIAAIRAHGNNVENVPLALILLLAAELCGGSSTALHAFGGALLVARLAHAFGLLKASKVQVVGALLNQVVQVGLAGYLLWLRPWG
ncbi:MAPEG family protein [Pyxidicoccus parkwayensis]|uniref:MAPEG family protein n=1 Tax=Pyxidicoccus parkwayensis TaxID=2813578 RepID=A0ABX7P424_9BACT|nr:MAPEG family protein [Pyxidicoccus parkwaysis]QSQ25167.1 MAPEG family protein [Pyxidicoccus parkwaysis]